MFDLAKKTAKCMYGDCQLPKNNNRYAWQVIYIFVGLFVLYRSPADFNFFQTFLFVTPIMIDIAYNGMSTKWLNVVRLIIGVVNALVLIGCLFGMAGLIEDKDTFFKISDTVIYFHGACVSKTIMGGVLAANLVVPIIYWIGSPCQGINRMVGAVSRKEVEQV